MLATALASMLAAAQASAGEANACAVAAGALSLTSKFGARDCAEQSVEAKTIEIKAEANDGGAYWFEGDDRRALARVVTTADAELNRAITFRAQNLTTPFGEVELHGGVGRSETSDALTFERLQWANGYRENTTAVGFGTVERLFDGRLTVSTDLAWSAGSSLWRDANAPGLSDIEARSGVARWHKFDAKLIDEPEFKWSLSGEMSEIEFGYRGNAAAQPTGTSLLAGAREKWTTKLEALGISTQASTDRFAGRVLTRESEIIQIDFDGVSASLYSKDLQRHSLLDASQWLSSKSIDGVSVEVTPQLAAPELAAEVGFLPLLVSITLESGVVDYPTGLQAREDIASLEALAIWKTKLGDTTATYSRERQGRETPATAFAGETDQLIDASHAIKFGAWRISAGASLTVLDSALPGDSFADNAVSGLFSIRYAPVRGPKLDASLGRSEDEFMLESLSLLQRSQATTLNVSLDLSDFVQDQLDRRDTNLTLRYRHQLHELATSYDALASEEASRNADAFLASFGTPLN